MRRSSRQPPGFSVMELCFVLAIVAALAIFLGGAMARARKANRQALDQVHLRQIGATLLLYSMDHQQVLPVVVTPSPFKTLSVYLGYLPTTNDWSNDQSTPKNSIFKPGADEAAIRQLFTSGYDDRPRPDPLNSFCTNGYIGRNPGEVLEPGEESSNAERLNEIRNPNRKIYMVPARYIVKNPYHTRFSGATTLTFFRPGSGGKTDFPALFMDGHTEMFDPYLNGMTLNASNNRWVHPKTE